MKGDKKLKEYMQDHFDFPSMKKAGVFYKEMKFNDYEAQAKRICEYLGIDDIYQYHELGKGTRYHITEDLPVKPDIVPYNQIPEFRPFARTIGGLGEDAKVIPFKTPSAP